MANKRTTVGAVLKSQSEGDTDYIKISGYTKDKLMDALSKVPSNGGLILKLESSSSLRKKAQELLKLEKISSAAAEAMTQRADKIPSFVRFEIVLVEENKK